MKALTKCYKQEMLITRPSGQAFYFISVKGRDYTQDFYNSDEHITYIHVKTIRMLNAVSGEKPRLSTFAAWTLWRKRRRNTAELEPKALKK